MSKTMNKVLLLGNVGKDPEIASTNGGTLVARLSLATSERFRDKQGEWQERTEWHNLVAYARRRDPARLREEALEAVRRRTADHAILGR